MSTMSAAAALAPQQRDCDHPNDVNNNTQDTTNNSNNNSDNEQQNLADESNDRMHLSSAKELSSSSGRVTDSIIIDKDNDGDDDEDLVGDANLDDSDHDDEDDERYLTKSTASSLHQTGIGFAENAINDSVEHNLSQPPNNNYNLLSEQDHASHQQRQHSDHKQLEFDQSTAADYKSNNNIEQVSAATTNAATPDTNLNEISANCKTMHNNNNNNNSQGAINAQMHACRLCDKLLSSSSSLDRHMLTHSGDRPFVCKRCHMTFTTNGNMHRHMRTHLHKDSLARQQLEQQIKSSLPPGALSSGSNSPAPNPILSAVAAAAAAAASNQQSSPSLLSALSSCNSRDLIIENKTSSNNNNLATESNQSMASMPIIDSLTSGSVAAMASTGATSLIAPLLTPDTIMAATAATQQQSGASVDGNAMTALLNQLLIAALSHQQQQQQQQQSSSPAARQLDQTSQEIARVVDPLESVETESIKSNHSQHLQQQQHITMATDAPSICSANTAITTSTTATPQTNSCNLLLQQPIRVSTSVANEQSSPSYYLSSAASSSTSSPINSPNHSHSAVAQSMSSSTPMSTTTSSHQNNVWPNQSQQTTMADETTTTSSNTFQQQQQQQSVVEDISQSYVKTANPNAARKGGKRNRHCYKCKLCTYSSVDRCTLVRHLRIHSGERPYICGICRYAFTTKANCERHVRKRHKKQYNSLGGAGGVKGGNGGGRSLIITDHNNHQTIPVKVNPVAAQTISQTLQKIQEKQLDNNEFDDDVVVDKGLNKNIANQNELQQQQQQQHQQQPLSHASSFTFEQNSHCTRQMMNSNRKNLSPSIVQSRSQTSGSRKRKQNGQFRVVNNLNPQMLVEQLTQSNVHQATNLLGDLPQQRDNDNLRHDKQVIDDVFRSKKLLGTTTTNLPQQSQESHLLPASVGVASGPTSTSVASLLFNQHMGPIANAIEMLSSAKHLSQQLALNSQNSFTNLLRQTPFNPIDLAAQALDLSCKSKTTE